MRAAPWLVGAIVALASACVVGCGGSSASSSRKSTTQLSGGYLQRDVDEDFDNSHGIHARYDLDDDPIRSFGSAAGAADASAIAALVGRYYADAAAGDGAAACPLVYGPLAESLPEQYAGTPERGATCTAVLSKLFRRHHGEYALRHATLQFTGVRVEGDQGFALVQFKGFPDHHLRVHREGGRWTVHQLLDEGLP